MNYSEFKDQIWAITGAGGEIGGGTAVEICKWGGKVALIDIHEGRLRETVEKCQQAGAARGDILDRVGDCTKPQDVELFFEAVSKKFGKVNALVNVVGTKRIKTLQTCELEDLEWVLNGNLKSMFLVTKTCLPHLMESKGNVINISSVSGMRPVWGALPYTMAKAAVDQFTRSISQELAPKGIRVNAVAPGALKSRFNMRFGDILATEEQLMKYYDVAGRSIPLGYMGTWEDVVPTVLFLGSDKSTFITGTVIPVDGSYVNTGKH